MTAVAALGAAPVVVVQAAPIASALAAGANGHPMSVRRATPFNAYLRGVAALPGGGAWAVGTNAPAPPAVSKGIIEHWNGSSWRLSPFTIPGGTGAASSLSGVVALFRSDVFAVGAVDFGGDTTETLIERWSGTSWKRMRSPNPGGIPGFSSLNAVAAVSPSQAWAVGSYFICSFCDPAFHQTLIEHWNGQAWRQDRSPSPGSGDSTLLGVTAVSAKDAWAVGSTTDAAGFDQTLIEHWNGTAWTRVRSPNPAGSMRSNKLYSVAAVSSSDIWAVGTAAEGLTIDTLIEHWNGSTWKQVRSPQGPAGSTGSFLYAVAAPSASSAWAVGTYAKNGAEQTLIERWKGTSWARVVSTDPGGPLHTNLLSAVAVGSASSVWAAGFFDATGVPDRTLTERWNGQAWSTVPSISR
jgi:hypothetical protein